MKLTIVSQRSAFDISHKDPDPFPTLFTSGFFNREWVQQDMGSPVNFTSDSLLSNNIILAETGDAFRRAGMKDVEYLLDNGVKIALIYGDRDYRCPWLGVETLSLAADWRGAEEYRAAGYEYIHTNKSYNGGVVRQYGNLSFSRVFEAGHDGELLSAPVSQPFNTQTDLRKQLLSINPRPSKRSSIAPCLTKMSQQASFQPLGLSITTPPTVRRAAGASKPSFRRHHRRLVTYTLCSRHAPKINFSLFRTGRLSLMRVSTS